jgi:hypothetical protein
MSRRFGKATVAVSVIVIAVLGGGFFLLGRITADRSDPRGIADARDAGYLAGLRAGVAQGRQEGRALQEGSALRAGDSKPAQDAFNAGYVAGANDTFAGFDGGWQLGRPYLVAIDSGSGQVSYRLDSRTLVQPRVNYFLCPSGNDMCQQPRP